MYLYVGTLYLASVGSSQNCVVSLKRTFYELCLPFVCVLFQLKGINASYVQNNEGNAMVYEY